MADRVDQKKNNSDNDKLENAINRTVSAQKDAISAIDNMMLNICNAFGSKRITNDSLLNGEVEKEEYVEYIIKDPDTEQQAETTAQSQIIPEINLDDLFDEDNEEPEPEPDPEDLEDAVDADSFNIDDIDLNFDNLEFTTPETPQTQEQAPIPEEDVDNDIFDAEGDPLGLNSDIDNTENSDIFEETEPFEEVGSFNLDDIMSSESSDEYEGDTFDIEQNAESEPIEASEPEEEDEPFDLSDINDTPISESESTQVINVSSAEKAEESSEPKDETTSEVKDLVKKLKNSTLTSKVDLKTKTLVDFLSVLYGGGFQGSPQAGIMLRNDNDASVITLKDKEGHIQADPLRDRSSSYENLLAVAITNNLRSLSAYTNRLPEGELIPDTFDGKTVVCWQLHLAFQKADIRYAKGKISINRWITEEMLPNSKCADKQEWLNSVNKSTTHLTNFGNVKSWYNWSVRNIIYTALAKDIIAVNARNSGTVKIMAADDDLYLVSPSYNVRAEQIMSDIIKNVKNIVTVADRCKDANTKNLVSEEIRICCGDNVNIEQLIQALNDCLNTGVTEDIKVSQLHDKDMERTGIISMRIVYDVEADNKSSVFAYEVMDSIIENGGAPRWDHALLGKKPDGSAFYWDAFMDPGQAGADKRCYTIYAGSRSGKGIMTSTLVAAAIASGKNVFYTDGKPENGPTMGRIAWEKGKEAYVFDGKPEGDRPFDPYLEAHTFNMRNKSETTEYLDKLPNCLWSTIKDDSDGEGDGEDRVVTMETHETFLALMRYLKSMCLCFSTILARSANKLPSDSGNNWNVWIFDEVTNMTRHVEKNIRKFFEDYIASKGFKALYTNGFSEFRKDLKLREAMKKDEGIRFIYNWNKWTNQIVSMAENAAVIALGKSNTNLIWIFQEATWLEDKTLNGCILPEIIKKLKSTKIVGKDALSNGCGEYGNAFTKKEAWYSTVCSGRGYWAISKSTDLGNRHSDDDVQLFKPYSVWTVPLKNDAIVDVSELREKNGNPVDPRKYFGGYMSYLEQNLGFDASEVLNRAWNYAENAVTTLGLASSLKEYIYDISNYSMNNEGSTLDDTQREARKLDEENGQSADTPIHDVEPEVVNSINLGFGQPEQPFDVDSIINDMDVNSTSEKINLDKEFGDEPQEQRTFNIDNLNKDNESDWFNDASPVYNRGNSTKEEKELSDELEAWLSVDARYTAQDEAKMAKVKFAKASQLQQVINKGQMTKGMAAVYFKNHVLDRAYATYNINDRRSKYDQFGLMGLVVTAGNLVVLTRFRVIVAIDAYDILNNVYSQNERKHISRELLIQLLREMDANRYPLDKMPTEQELQRMLDKINSNTAKYSENGNEDVVNMYNESNFGGYGYRKDYTYTPEHKTEAEMQFKRPDPQPNETFEHANSNNNYNDNYGNNSASNYSDNDSYQSNNGNNYNDNNNYGNNSGYREDFSQEDFSNSENFGNQRNSNDYQYQQAQQQQAYDEYEEQQFSEPQDTQQFGQEQRAQRFDPRQLHKDVDDYVAHEEEYNSQEARANRNPFAQPDQDVTNTKQSVFMNKDGDVNLDPRGTQEVFKFDSVTDAFMQKYSPAQRFKKKLFESRNGMSYEFKKIGEAIMIAIERTVGAPSQLSELVLDSGNNSVIANGKPVGTGNLLGGEYEVQLKQIIVIKDLFKKFKYITKLTVDQELYNKILCVYGYDFEGTKKIFKENKMLQVFNILPGIKYTRAGLEDIKQQEHMKKMLEKEKAKSSLEFACARRNPRLGEKAPGYLLNVFDNGMSLSGQQFKKAYSKMFDDKSPHVASAFGYSLLGSICVVVGSVAGLGGTVLGLVTPKRKQ
jgi:hypothetical protein